MRTATFTPRSRRRTLATSVLVTLSLLVSSVPWISAAAAERTPKRATARFKCSAVQQGGRTKLVPLRDRKTGACTGFEVHDLRGRTISVHRDAVYGSGRFISDTLGRRVIFVADFPRAQLLKSGRFTLPGGTSSKPRPVEALAVFFDGKRVAGFSLERLLHRPFLVDVQGQHVRWLDGDTGFLRGPVGRTLTLTTSSFRELTVDTETGQVIAEADDARWRTCDLIVYGNISTFADGTCGAKPYWVVKGLAPTPLHFDLDDQLTFSNGPQTACLQRVPAPSRGRQKLKAVSLSGPLSGLATATSTSPVKEFLSHD